jgi:serine/threonine-protein kinase
VNAGARGSKHAGLRGHFLRLGLCAALTVPVPAAAEPNARSDADVLFAEGRRLMAEGKPEQACLKFEQSQGLDPATGTLINLARCYARLGRTASAWTTYQAAASQSHAAGQTKRESVARAQADALEPELAKLELDLTDGPRPEGFEVLLDGVKWPGAASGLATPLDPGPHSLVARAPGFVEWSQHFDAIPREHTEIHVPVLHEAPAASANAMPKEEPSAQSVRTPGSAAPAPTRPRTTVRSELARRHGSANPIQWRTVGLVLGGAGIVGLGVGAGFGLRARRLDSESREDDHCEPGIGCDSRGLELNRAARDAAAISTVLFVSGTVLSVTGVTLYLFGDASRSSIARCRCRP